jgi:hypothetical protein
MSVMGRSPLAEKRMARRTAEAEAEAAANARMENEVETRSPAALAPAQAAHAATAQAASEVSEALSRSIMSHTLTTAQLSEALQQAQALGQEADEVARRGEDHPRAEALFIQAAQLLIAGRSLDSRGIDRAPTQRLRDQARSVCERFLNSAAEQKRLAAAEVSEGLPPAETEPDAEPEPERKAALDAEVEPELTPRLAPGVELEAEPEPELDPEVQLDSLSRDSPP